MALNFMSNSLKLKPAGIGKPATRVAKLVKDRTLKTPSIAKINVLKDVTSKPFDFSKMTKVVKLPKPAKITLIKKAIKKAAKPKGF